MASQALYRKWRSQSFDEVVGQEHVTLTLRNALREGRMSHAYLFAGPRGTGKTSTARILAKAINCTAEDLADRPCGHCHICTAISEGRLLDLIEIDAASNRGIDEIRDLREKIGFRPNEARFKVYIIDEVHMLTKEAFNALLKTLEEPPSHVVFVLATTEPDRVPETVRSRCQRFDFRRIPTAKIARHLAVIVEAEGTEAAPEALAAIARRATGSMRDAISLLDQLLSYGDAVLELTRVERVLGLVNPQTIGQLIGHIAENEASDGLALINRLVADGVELGELVDQIVAYLRAVLFAQVTGAPDLLDLSSDVTEAVVRLADRMTPATILMGVREFMAARCALRDQVPGVPQLPLEMAFLRSALPASAQTTATVKVSALPAQPVAAVGVGNPAQASPPATVRSAPEQISAQTASVVSEPAPARSVTASSGGPAEVADTAALLPAAQAAWDRFLNLAGKRCGMKVQAALRSVREIDVVGQTLVLQFAHAFSRDLVGTEENLTQVEALWEKLLDRKLPVRCIVVGESLPPDTAPANRPAAQVSQHDDESLLDSARELGAVVKRLG